MHGQVVQQAIAYGIAALWPLPYIGDP